MAKKSFDDSGLCAGQQFAIPHAFKKGTYRSGQIAFGASGSNYEVGDTVSSNVRGVVYIPEGTREITADGGILSLLTGFSEVHKSKLLKKDGSAFGAAFTAAMVDDIRYHAEVVVRES